jgi:hypothetical protein
MAIRTLWHPFEGLRSTQDELAQMHGMPAGALGRAASNRRSLPAAP